MIVKELHDDAVMRQRELLSQAAEARLARQARQPRPLRYRLGSWLIRLGHNLVDIPAAQLQQGAPDEYQHVYRLSL